MVKKFGISVILPSKAGSETLHSALESLAEQTLEKSRFEVILVLNGPSANTFSSSKLRGTFPQLNLRVFRSEKPGASRARNIGLLNASFEFSTFLDDDDCLEPAYLETGLGLAQPNVCVLMPIVDVQDGHRNEANSLNTRIRAMAGSVISLSMVPWILGFNACKIVSTELLSSCRYDESLRSGEDLVFFAKLLRHPRLIVQSPKAKANISYLRVLRENSISRQDESFEFNVVQRLQCISRLRTIEFPLANQSAIKSLESSQFGFVSRYLSQHREDVDRAIEEAVSLGVGGLEWEPLRIQRAKRVIFSYCFPPYADTSANVVSKVIRAEATPVDVYFANMSRVRARDESTRLITEPYVVHSEEINAEPSFADWDSICDFASKAIQAAGKQQRKRGRYESMYSRALWSGSHVAAMLFKTENPHLTWEAEFSDPLALGVDGRLREGRLTRNRVTKKMRKAIYERGWGNLEYSTHFELTEIATLSCADRIIFTNCNQRLTMLERYPEDFRKSVIEKSQIRPHLSPPSEMYHLTKVEYPLDSAAVNLAYFGNFYANRGLGDVLSVLEERVETGDSIALHVFTSQPEKLREEYRPLVEKGVLRVNEYVSYLEFLNLSTKFDALVVTDVTLENTALSVNPFLPSKYADYTGSGVPIWGITSPNSPLSKAPLQFKSELGSKVAARKVLSELANNPR